jgi:hypothetical protein
MDAGTKTCIAACKSGIVGRHGSAAPAPLLYHRGIIENRPWPDDERGLPLPRRRFSKN